jgi:eukaryotic-like serine/threonine-protein kinase
VSRHHVELRRVGANWEIVNLGTNGTYLDGKRITQVPVGDGAIIRLARSGPNIQIRMGSEAAKEHPDAVVGDRTVSQKFDAPQISMEITSQPIGGDASKMGRPPELEADSPPLPPKGTIPVPPHLQLPPEPTLNPFRTVVGVSTIALTELPTQIQPITQISAAGNCQHRQDGSLFCPDCGQPIQVLRTLGAYQLVKVLGQGEIGITYLARREGQSFVLKTLNSGWLNHPEAQAALECEAEVLRQLNHPQLPHLSDYAESGEPYLVMELMPGQTLVQYVASQGAVTVAQAIAWMLQICGILSYLHSFTPPILHRDIKPANLLCTQTGDKSEIALVGFGAIKAIVLGQTMTDSKGYAAPEQLDIDVTPAVDLYSLGATLVYLLTGRDPVLFFSESHDQKSAFNTKAFSGLDPMLSTIVQTLTHTQADQRYPTAADLAAALRQVTV